MRVLCLILLLRTVFAGPVQEHSYVNDVSLCHPWSCINQKLGLTDSLSSSKQVADVIKSLLPEGVWRKVAENAINVCFTDSIKNYEDTCPGQALLNCLVDQLNQNCPEESQQKDDACSSITSLAGQKFMFAQSLYENFEKDRVIDSRPFWFMSTYFRSNCCRIPQFINIDILSQCGFHKFIQRDIYSVNATNFAASEQVKSVIVPPFVPIVSTNNDDEKQQTEGVTETPKALVHPDPLDCCNMDEFIKQSWRSECDFGLQWEVLNRLSVVSMHTTPAPPTTPSSLIDHDGAVPPPPDVYPKEIRQNKRVVPPHPCKNPTPSTTCLLNKMGVLDQSGAIDNSKMLGLIHQFASTNPEWTPMEEVYTSAFNSSVLYQNDCATTRIFLNLLDFMIMTCPVSKRSNALLCSSILFETSYSTPVNLQDTSKREYENILNQFRLVFFPTPVKQE